jgi:hypothetical protein
LRIEKKRDSKSAQSISIESGVSATWICDTYSTRENDARRISDDHARPALAFAP